MINFTFLYIALIRAALMCTADFEKRKKKERTKRGGKREKRRKNERTREQEMKAAKE